MVDEGKLGFKTGVAISYLKPETQNLLYSEIIMSGEKIKQSQIKELKILDECGVANKENIKTVFKKSIKSQVPSITISGDRLEEYADILPSSKEIERLFLEFLKTYSSSVKQS